MDINYFSPLLGISSGIVSEEHLYLCLESSSATNTDPPIGMNLSVQIHFVYSNNINKLSSAKISLSFLGAGGIKPRASKLACQRNLGEYLFLLLNDNIVHDGYIVLSIK